METLKTTRRDYIKAWVVSMRPQTLILSLAPFFVGTLLSSKFILSIDWMIMAFAILSAFFIQVGTNFINDVYDFKNKADTLTRLGPKRGIHHGILNTNEVFIAGLGAFVLSLLLGIPLVIKGGGIVCLILVTAVCSGFFYTGGPKPLAYNGLGEVFVIIFFGLISTTCAFFFQTGYLSTHVILLGLELGLLASLPIAINNLRDIKDDTKVNKQTLAVRFGKTFARIEITLFAFLPFVIDCFVENRLMAPLTWVAMPIAFLITKSIWKSEPSVEYNTYLKQSIMLYIIFSAMLIAGILV